MIRYPWHPFAGIEIVILREFKTNPRTGHGGMLCCLVGKEANGGVLVPLWMFDEVACSAMHLSEQPRVSLDALFKLRTLLRDARSGPRRDGVDAEHAQRANKGHAQTLREPSHAISPARSARPTATLSDVGNAVAGSEEGTMRIADRALPESRSTLQGQGHPFTK